MSRIFISYRRSDSTDVTGRIYDHLLPSFGRDYLFKDVDSIPATSDFKVVIAETLRTCDVVVVIIGSAWLTATDGKGGRRLDDPEDFVRLEIEAALAREMPILPVLVGDTAMPSPEQLPDSLRSLSNRNAVSVRPDPDFKSDVERLASKLNRLVKRRGLLHRVMRAARSPRIVALAALFVALLLALPFARSYFGARKLVMALDSYAQDVVYDEATFKEMKTNANDIYVLLSPLKDQIDVDSKLVTKQWDTKQVVIDRNPDLVIVHPSSFYGMRTDLEDSRDLFLSFLRDMAKTKSKFLIYSRTLNLSTEEARKEYIARLVKEVPELDGRLWLFTFGPEERQTFRNNDLVTNRFVRMVKDILDLK